jgi:hypothetical protein
MEQMYTDAIICSCRSHCSSMFIHIWFSLFKSALHWSGWDDSCGLPLYVIFAPIEIPETGIKIVVQITKEKHIIHRVKEEWVILFFWDHKIVWLYRPLILTRISWSHPVLPGHFWCDQPNVQLLTTDSIADRGEWDFYKKI